MRKISTIVKKYPITTVLIIVIWVICIIPIPETPLHHVSMMDKWTHIAMYFVLSLVIAWEGGIFRWKSRKMSRVILYIWLLPSLMGGVLELVQAYCTGGTRSGDWLDFLADVIGSTIAALICILPVRCRARD